MIKFDNSYKKLPVEFYQVIDFTNDYDPNLIVFNHKLAEELGLGIDGMDKKNLAKYFSAASYMKDSEPLAMAYAGHQFGHFVPSLGDGRAMLLGEFIAKDKKRYDIHLKGSGRTLYSRGGDGKSALGPVLREYIVSEAMYALGVPTTRTLCAVRTGEFVQRETLQQGAVSTRIGLAHIRIGTFEYFAAREDLENLRKLTEYSIARLYPEVLKLDVPILEFWKRVARNQMQLVAKWMSLGFIHGVMNTDNMLISGETIDYGPCAFMDNFESQKVFSSIDRNGRYSYSNQPQIALWNLVRLAGCLMPLIDKEQKELQEFFKKEVEAFHQFFLQEHEKMMMAKLGLGQKMEGDKELLTEWLEFLEHNELDFTLSYIDLERILEEKEPFTKLKTVPNFDSFFKKWSHRVKEKRDDAMAQMKRVNPFTIPRNHQVQKVIEFSEKNDDSYFFQMLEAISHPFERREEWGVFQKPPTPEERILKTFCGT